MNYLVPEEDEFFSQGFEFSDYYDHDEGVISFSCKYETNIELIFTHSPMCGNYISVELKINGEKSSQLYLETKIHKIEFQGWHSEQIIRVYFEGDVNKDLKVFYSPKPRIDYSDIK